MDKRHKGATGLGKKTFAVALAAATLCWGIGFAMFGPVMLNTAEAAATTAHPNGVLVDIGDANHTIYLISGGQRQGIPSPTVFASHGYSFDKVVPANDYDKALTEGSVITYADGTLVNDNGTIYLIGNGQKRGFTTPEVYTGLGYSFTGSSIVVPEATYTSTFATYTTGAVINSASEAHPNGALVDVDGTVFQVSNGTLVGIPSQAVMNSRGLSLDNVVTANAADRALTVGENMKFADGTLVLDTTDNMTVYVVSDGQKLGVTTPAALEAYGYQWGNVVSGDMSGYTAGAVITDGTTSNVPTTTGTNAVSISSTSPTAGVVASGAQDATFMDLVFTAADATGYTISSLAITRNSISQDSDLTAIELYEGSTRQGSAQALNTTTHKATFTGLNIAVTSSTPRTITVKGDIYSSAGVGNSITLGIASASDITATATLAGTFPMYSAAKTVATASVGTVTVDTLATPAASSINSGSTEQQVGSIKFTASSTEALSLNSFRLTQVGTAGDADVSNITVKYGATTLASVAGFSNSMATISLSPALSINASASKTIDVYVDVAAGINTSRTVRVEVTQSTDVSATGTSSSGVVTVSAASAFPEQGAEHTVTQGTLTTAKDSATDPSAQNYVKGTSSRNVTALRFSAGSTEGVRVTQVTLTSAGTATPSDISNFTMWRKLADTEAAQTGDITEDGYKWRYIATGNISGSSTGFTVQFGTNTTNSFDTGLFEVAKSNNQIVRIKADVSSAATADRTIIMSVSSASHVKADGLVSQMDVPSASVTGTTTGSTLTIASSGSLTVSLNSTSPAAATVGKATTGVEFTKIDLRAGTGENILVSSLTVRAYEASGTANAADTDEITNIALYDGTTQIGTTVARPTSGVAAFSPNITVAAGATKTLTVKADVPSDTTAEYLHIDLPGAGTIADDITSTGVSSGADITETGSATGNLMTVASPTITASMASSLGASNEVVNSTGRTIGRLALVAGAGENVIVSTVKISFDDANTLNGTSSADSYLNNIKLVDKDNHSTQYGETKDITDGTADYAQFNGITNLTIEKSSTKYIDILADVKAGSGTYYCGVYAEEDITGSGLSSTPVTSTGTGVSAGVTIRAYGVVTTAVDTSSPIAANHPVGTAGLQNIEVAKFKFTTQYEAVKIKTLTVTTNSANYNDAIAAVKLYAGGVQIGQSMAFSGTNTTLTFDMINNPYELAKDADTIITVKCDYNGVGSGVTQGDSPRISIADPSSDITYQGSQSQSTSIADQTSSALNPTLHYLYKTTATVALVTSASEDNSLSGLDIDGGAATPSATQTVLAVLVINNGTAELDVSSFDLTPSFTGTTSGTTGISLYFSDDMSTAIGTGAGTDDNPSGAILTGVEIAITPTDGLREIAAGETKYIIVKADTRGLGATAANTFNIDLVAVSDFGWIPNGGSEVTERTKNLPITGPTYTYTNQSS